MAVAMAVVLIMVLVVAVAVLRPERVGKYVVRDLSSLGDASRFVERPMNTEIDSALAVFFLGLRERREGPGEEGTDIAVCVSGNPVEFVGYERKANVVGSVKVSQSLEQSAAKPSVTGRISGERGRKIVPVGDITGGCTER